MSGNVVEEGSPSVEREARCLAPPEAFAAGAAVDLSSSAGDWEARVRAAAGRAEDGGWMWIRLPNRLRPQNATRGGPGVAAVERRLGELGWETALRLGVVEGRALLALRTCTDLGPLPALLGIVRPWKRAVARRRWGAALLVPAHGVYARRPGVGIAPWLADLVGALDWVLPQAGQCSVWHHAGGSRGVREVAFAARRGRRLARLGETLAAVALPDRERLGLDGWRPGGAAGVRWIDRPFREGSRRSPAEILTSPRRERVVELLAAVARTPAAGGGEGTGPETLAEVTDRYTDDRPERAVPAELRARLGAVVGRLSADLSPRPTFQHGDVTANNLLFDGERPFLIDWEWCGWTEAPGFDLLNVLYPALRDRRTPSGAWRELLLGARDDTLPAALERDFRAVWPDADPRAGALAFWAQRMARNLYHGEEWARRVLAPTLDLVEASR